MNLSSTTPNFKRRENNMPWRISSKQMISFQRLKVKQDWLRTWDLIIRRGKRRWTFTLTSCSKRADTIQSMNSCKPWTNVKQMPSVMNFNVSWRKSRTWKGSSCRPMGNHFTWTDSKCHSTKRLWSQKLEPGLDPLKKDKTKPSCKKSIQLMPTLNKCWK